MQRRPPRRLNELSSFYNESSRNIVANEELNNSSIRFVSMIDSKPV